MPANNDNNDNFRPISRPLITIITRYVHAAVSILLRVRIVYGRRRCLTRQFYFVPYWKSVSARVINAGFFVRRGINDEGGVCTILYRVLRYKCRRPDPTVIITIIIITVIVIVRRRRLAHCRRNAEVPGPVLSPSPPPLFADIMTEAAYKTNYTSAPPAVYGRQIHWHAAAAAVFFLRTHITAIIL